MIHNNKTIRHLYQHVPIILPDAYQEVEWLQSDGKAHIDTGIKPTINDTITSVFKGTFNTATSNIIYSSCYGAWNASPNNWFMLRLNQSLTDKSLIMWHRLNVTGRYSLGSVKKIDDSNIHTVSVRQLGNQCTIDIDGVSESTSVETRTIESEQPNYWLLSYAATASVETGNTVKLYRWSLIHAGDTLIRDFVPCYRKSDSEPGMYDIINNVFYTNAGTGEFTCGGVVHNKTILRKRISRITRGNDVIFRDNLFNGYDSEWSLHIGIYTSTGNLGAEVAEPRLVFFFKVKPNTTYRYTSLTAGDRMCVYAINEEHDVPPVPANNTPPYGASIRIIETRYAQSGLTDYTFTTSSSDRMVYILCAREVRPTGIFVREV